MQKDKTPAFHLLVIDGNQSENKKQRQNKWSTSRLPPAFAGMTNKTAPPCKDRSRPVGRPRGGMSLQTPIHQSENPVKRSFLGAVEKAFIKGVTPQPPLSGGLFFLPTLPTRGIPPSSVGIHLIRPVNRPACVLALPTVSPSSGKTDPQSSKSLPPLRGSRRSRTVCAKADAVGGMILKTKAPPTGAVEKPLRARS